MTSIPEQLGRALYRYAGLDPLTPPAGGAADVAIRIHGGGVLRFQPWAPLEADLATIGGARRIVIRRGVSAARLNFLIGRELARMHLERDAAFCCMSAPERDYVLRETGAWLAAPTPAFAARAAASDFHELALAFVITETTACLRIAETVGPASAVTTPSRVYRKGRQLSWLDDDGIRALSRKSNPRSVRKVAVRDEPGRVALFAR